jgi:hypothetical protein
MRKDGKQVDAELRGHGEWGWECQFLYNGEPAYGRRWVTRAAIAEADERTGRAVVSTLRKRPDDAVGFLTERIA